MIDYEYAELFEQDSLHKSLLISYDGGSITNTELESEKFEMQESICSQNELVFGCCESSYVKFSVGYGTQQLEGKELTITTTPQGGTPLALGKFKVFSDTPTADRRWRDVIAYDAMYDILNVDLADWYNSLFENTSEMTLKIFRDSLFTELGITQVETTLINDDMIIEKTINPKILTGKDILLPLCEINACFGRMTRDGKFEYVYLQPPTQGLFPDTILFPQETGLYPTPNGNAQEVGKNGNYKNVIYQDYITELITKLQIREKENDIGVIVGDGDNMYVIENNFLVYGKGTSELTPIATNILNKIKYVYFCPCTIDAPGNPCLQPGDGVKLVTKYSTIETYILKRVLTGIQALQDEYTAEGSRQLEAQKYTLQKELIQLKGKSNELERTIEQTQSTITDVEAGLQTQITQNANSITAEVTRATTSEGTITNSLNNEVQRAQTREGQLSASIQAMPTSIMAQVASTYETIGNVTTKVNNAVSTAEGYTNTQLGNYYTKTETDAQIVISEGVVETHVQNNYYNKTTVDGFITGLQDQIDNRTTLYTVDEVPTLNNYPAEDWTTDALKDQHINDIALVSSSDPAHAGENYRFEKKNGVYAWNIVQDTVATQALARANEALQGIDDINDDLETNYYTSSQTDTKITAGEGRVESRVAQNYELKTEVTRKVNEALSDAEDYAEGYTDNVLLSYTDTQTMETLIEQSANNIVSLVTTSLQKYDEGDYTITLYGYGTPTASAAVYVNKYYLDQMNGYLYLSNGSDWSKVDELDLIVEELQTQISQNADAITTKVSNGEISSKLSQEAGQITISANRLVIDSTGFKLDSNGKAQFISSDSDTRFLINDISDQASNYIVRSQKFQERIIDDQGQEVEDWYDTFTLDKDGNASFGTASIYKLNCNRGGIDLRGSITLIGNYGRKIGTTNSYFYWDTDNANFMTFKGNIKQADSSYSTSLGVISSNRFISREIVCATTPTLSSWEHGFFEVTNAHLNWDTSNSASSSSTDFSVTRDGVKHLGYMSANRFKFNSNASSSSSTYFEGVFKVSTYTSSGTPSYYVLLDQTQLYSYNPSEFKLTSNHELTMTSAEDVLLQSTGTFNKVDVGAYNINLNSRNNLNLNATSSLGTLKVNGYNVVIGYSSNGKLGFFSSTGNTKQTVNKLSSSATLAQTVTKVNDLLTALKNYGLITSS